MATSLKPAAAGAVFSAPASALAKSLRDPKVLEIAQSLNLNLQDPGTRNRLLAEASALLANSTEVNLTAPGVQTPHAPSQIQSPYVRNAIRTYLEIAAMG